VRLRSNWFVPLNDTESFRILWKQRNTLQTRDSTGKTAYWFRHVNLQTSMVSSMFAEPNWVICDTSRLDALTRAMSRLRHPPLKPQFVHSLNATPGWGDWLVRWARRVPWESVSHIYELDSLLHAKLASKCIWNLRPELQHIAPTS
jgi:hypothetical protein